MTNKTQFERVLQLIDNVYEAALDDGCWSEMAPRIAETFGSTSTTLQIQRVGDSSQILSMTDNVNARISDYRAHYWQRDIWVERAVQLIGMSRVGSSRDMVSDTEFSGDRVLPRLVPISRRVLCGRRCLSVGFGRIRGLRNSSPAIRWML